MATRLTLPLALALLVALAGCTAPASSAGAAASTVGTRAPLPGAVTDTTGVTHDLDAARTAGKNVALVFWQPWCGSCKEESKAVVAALEKDGGETLEVFGVVSGPAGTVDDAEVERSRTEWGLTYPVVRDTSMVLGRAFGVTGVPRVVIVDPDGRIAYDADVPPASWVAWD